MRHSVLWGKNWKGKFSDRHFQEPILCAQFLYLFISRKALKSFMVMTLFLVTSRKFHETSRKLLEKYVFDYMYSTFTKIM